MTDEIPLEEMLDPLERMFEREYPVQPLIRTFDPNGAAHFAVVEPSSRNLHAVRIEGSYSDCIFDLDSGIHAAQDLKSNRRWIALPLDEFRDGEEEYRDVMMGQCKSRGVGIITIQQKGKGFSAKVILEADLVDGDYLESFPALAEQLATADTSGAESAGFRVVSIHD